MNRRTRDRRASPRYSEVVVGGLKTARLSRQGMAALMVDDCLASRRRERTPRLIFTANGHSIALAATDAKFRAQLKAANLIHADGQPVVWASKMTRSPIPERTATTDFIHDAAAQAQKHGLKFFLLGASEDINARCAETLKKHYPALEIAGRRHGYFRRHGEERQVCEAINTSGADVVWVGLGVPLEQDFCVRNKTQLNAGWLVTSGGLFNFVAGDYTRAPQWMQALSLEWLYRLAREPGRLFWRYATTNPLAALMMMLRTRTPKGRMTP
ncbi:MAG TPA: WecB/TagA/CpsF family glycosyltransferase [Rhizomicrobium sp.]|jgi:exopolysaccharide biosynthesis WecB/TagA/CpsF family protein|nr:WecB/TagA/CpsF family glycosyltransferase [Rhizomicrobium sp.]